MYLKRLELHGFKSFPEKTALEFGQGITAVVGPNGSGKSNVSDALRWALGEMSAKSLRGAKMEDVIFTGTQNRRPLGFAEVAMTIDNADRKMPLDFNEITVTRRAYRSGESQYLLNGAACRLKDIHELFMDTGVGREGYSIIGQGRIDEILNAKGDERRLLFEEAAGIVKYKSRKTEAEGKLERERQNLLRVDDIIAELDAQLGPLAEQAETAKKYLQLAERQKILSVNLFLMETDNAEAALAKFDADLANARAQIEAENAACADARGEAAQAKARAAELTAEIERAIGAEGSLELAIEQAEGKIALCRQNDEHAAAEAARLTGEIAARRQMIADSHAMRADYDEKRAAAEMERAAAAAQTDEQAAALSDLNLRLAEAEGQITGYADAHIGHLKGTTEVAERIARAEAAYEQLEARQEDVNAERAELAERAARHRQTRQIAEEDLARKNEQTRLLAERVEHLYEEKYRAQQELIAAKAELDAHDAALKDANARHKALSDMERAHEGYYRSVRDILRAKAEHPSRFAGIRGAVADLARPRAGYEVAVEIALGGAVQNVVVETERDAQAAIAFLKERKAGRATFLPISAVKGRNLRERDKLLAERGVLGTADDFADYDAAYAGVFAQLLAGTLVVDTLDNAVSLSKKYRQELRIVTIEGELLAPGGAMTGGSMGKQGASLLSRGAEIARLAELIAELRESGQGRAETVERLNAALEAVSEQIEKNKMLAQEIELGKASVTAAAAQAAEALAELEKRGAALDEEERLAMERIVALNAEIRLLREEKRGADAQIADVLAEMARLRAQADALKLERDRKNRGLSDCRVKASKAGESAAFMAENAARAEGDAVRYEQDIAAYEQAIAEAAARRVALETEAEGYRAEIERLKATASEGGAKLQAIRDAHNLAQTEADRLETAAASRAEMAALLNVEAARLEEQRARREEEGRRWYDLMWDEYGLTRQAALKLPRLEGMTQSRLTRDERDVKNEIRALGSVNTAAIEEYRAVGERHAFLKQQRDDVLAAEEKLKTIIGELEDLMRARFTEQFAVISENFSAVFAEMFGGGTARVALAEDGDPLSAPIDIIAQPPGKRLQNMSLLSGGERALTAIALLFAILRMKPSPFCVLDEVEAALDDANTRRFAGFLRNFSGDTQFIVITHSKGTMEAADRLYGVTMQEQGVSKLVGARFDD